MRDTINYVNAVADHYAEVLTKNIEKTVNLVYFAACVLLSYKGIEALIHQEERNMEPEDLTAEQKTELTDEQIKAASGGTGGSSPALSCPSCGSTDIGFLPLGEGFYECRCNNCGYEWEYPY